MEMKRINKLFSNESMYLRDVLIIPIDDPSKAPNLVQKILSTQSSINSTNERSVKIKKKIKLFFE